MMFRWLITFLLVCIVARVGAQPPGETGTPDYKKIERQVQDPASPLYYPKLFARYKAGDSTLTQKEYYFLYYGYFYSDDYESYTATDYRDSIKELYKKGEPNEEGKKRGVRYAQKGLEHAPFDLSFLNVLCTIYNDRGDKADYDLNRRRFRGIAAVIMASGDGRTKETGYHVISVSDEYMFMSAIGLQVAGHQSFTDIKCDYPEAKENSRHIKGLYFDVRQLFEGYYRVPKQDKNGTKK